MINKNNNAVVELNEKVMEEIDEKLAKLLEEIVDKHGCVLEEFFICLSYFNNDLLDTIDELNVELEAKDKLIKNEISEAQKLINSKMN